MGIDKGRLGEEAERISVIIKNSTSKSLILLNETFSSTRSVDGYFLGRDVIKILMKLKCNGIYVTHFGELADDIDALNQEVQEGSRLTCLTAGIEDTDGMGVTGNRTFRINRMKAIGHGYSKDIVLKHGLSSEQIIELLKKRGYFPCAGRDKNGQ
ncbi:MAG: DNA mismatch repair protein MutS [Firmicutes bacterium ADurb.Bin419]|nr:MAG: DNA mismatch repair protein MutS [Firmicutes bacterium ADurb.Bin419]